MTKSDLARSAAKPSIWYAIITLPTAVFQAQIIETARDEFAGPWAGRVEAVVGDFGLFAFLVLVAILPFWLYSATNAERKRLRWGRAADSLTAVLAEIREGSMDYRIDASAYLGLRVLELQTLVKELQQEFPQPSILNLAIMGQRWRELREADILSELRALSGYANDVAARVGHQREMEPA